MVILLSASFEICTVSASNECPDQGYNIFCSRAAFCTVENLSVVVRDFVI